MLKSLFLREIGQISPQTFITRESIRKTYDLDLSCYKSFARVHHPSVNSLSIDTSEKRYLLSGGGEGKIAIFDLMNFPTFPSDSSSSVELKPICEAARDATRNTHQCAISCVVWFPFDTGIFISSGFDKCIKVWDTNKMLPVYDFKMERKVNGQAMSSCATFHSLIAAATDDPNVKLCDLQSGTAVHILKVLAFSTSSGLHVISTTSYRPGITKFAASTA
ncbi:uncharacterized protein LOC135121090 isoform X2 [Zophobas morio]|uniref:uncharacterized protein LOC135121090 isoform X2 n=1 Tax=Zophobas morio TaxID=2755281 RepID=UPI003082773D